MQHHHHVLPLAPTWMISLLIILFAAIPHKIPAMILYPMQTILGEIILAVIATAVFWVEPIIGIAIWIFLVSIILDKTHALDDLRSKVTEPFDAVNLSKDSVQTRQRWLVEKGLDERPDAINTRTEDPTLTVDTVQNKHRWQDEMVLGEHTVGIEERQVGDIPIYTRSGYTWQK